MTTEACGRFSRLHADERGGEVLEWALVSGLLLAAVLTAVASVAGKVVDRWWVLGARV